jgi:preprotein translocase subunit SecE
MNGEIQSVPAKTKVKKRSFFRFIQELKTELKKVSWTTKKELKVNVKVVILSAFIFGLGVYLADILIKSSLQGISALARLISG